MILQIETLITGQHPFFIQGVGIGILEQFPDPFDPVIKLFTASLSFLFVSPVCCKTAFSDLVHATASYLYFYPVPMRAHNRDMERFVTIGFWG